MPSTDMKMPRLPKLPKLKLPRIAPPRKKLDARVRTGASSMIDDYDQDEPQTKLSSAFIVVLLLHAVAVGGIYAFNSIKASRRAQEPLHATTPAAAKPSASAPPAGESERAAPASGTTMPVASTTAPINRARSYTVKPGDNLTGIARQFAVSVADLENANGLKPGAMLRIGQALTIPPKANAARPSDTAKTETRTATTAEAKNALQSYTVKSGDRLLFIAKRFAVSPDELAALNKLKDPGKLQVGQTLKIPPKKSP